MDILTNQRSLLPYDGLCHPVFQLDIQGTPCTFMLDTGSTCNLAFPGLLEKFPFIKLLPCGVVVRGVGGLTKPLPGKLYISITIANQTITDSFMVSDDPIANLDGLVGVGLLKQFHSWSVGGSADTGAYLEINKMRMKLCWYKHGPDVVAKIFGYPEYYNTTKSGQPTCLLKTSKYIYNIPERSITPHPDDQGHQVELGYSSVFGCENTSQTGAVKKNHIYKNKKCSTESQREYVTNPSVILSSGDEPPVITQKVQETPISGSTIAKQHVDNQLEFEHCPQNKLSNIKENYNILDKKILETIQEESENQLNDILTEEYCLRIDCNGGCEERGIYEYKWYNQVPSAIIREGDTTKEQDEPVERNTEVMLEAKAEVMESNREVYVPYSLKFTCANCGGMLTEGSNCSCRSEEKEKGIHPKGDVKVLYQTTTTKGTKRGGKAGVPQYSTLFKSSQWMERLMCADDMYEDWRGQQVYATEEGYVSIGGIEMVRVWVEGKLNNGSYQFTPFFDQQQSYIVNLKAKGPNIVTIPIINHIHQSVDWEEGRIIGILEEIQEVWTPTHVCTGEEVYGREEQDWYTGKNSHDVFATTVSLNQQVNVYKDNNGLYIPGPAPEPQDTQVVSLIQMDEKTKDHKPQILQGDFRERQVFGACDVIVHQVDACTVTSHGLSQTLENSYPYGSVYRKKTGKDNILPEDQFRPLGNCILSHDGSTTNPLIASLISQLFYGRATNDKGRQEDYISKYADKCSLAVRNRLLGDTLEQRLCWFQESLEDLWAMLKRRYDSGKDKILRVFFPKQIGHGKLNAEGYEGAVQKFTSKVSALGIRVYMIASPLEDKKSIGEYPSIPPARAKPHQHMAGKYWDAPTRFCKDPSCKGCKDNKAIIDLLDQDINSEEENHQPMTGIQDGMSPDAEVPSVSSEEERRLVFEAMLEQVRLGIVESHRVEQVKSLLRRYSKLFITSDQEPAGLIKGLEVDLPTTGPPIYCKMRRFNPKALKIMEEINQTMLRKGLTRPCDGPWSSPVVLVKKKPVPGQKWNPDDPKCFRFCIDYRLINEKSIVWKAYPTCNLKQQLQNAAGFQWYSTMDINSAFHCVAIRRASQPITAFALPSGLWCFTRLPFGLSISPQIWAKAADTILRPVRDVSSHYADDIICHSNGFEQHLMDLERVLERLMTSGVKCKLEKCSFFLNSVSWLGHIISEEGISPDPQGVETIRNLGPPRNVSELRSVLGSLNYFKDFIPKYADIAAPLSELLKKRKMFDWGGTQEQALQALKEALMSESVLVKADFTKDFYLQCDASMIAISVILSQMDMDSLLRPIQYWGKKLTPTEQNYGMSEKEAYSVYLGFKHFEDFLLLNTTHVLTDASVLKAFYGAREVPNKRILRWSLYIGQFHHTITHIRGHDNDLADVCSRCVKYPAEQVCHLVARAEGIPTIQPIRQEDIRGCQDKENPWQQIRNFLLYGIWNGPVEELTGIKERYSMNDQGLLCVKDTNQMGPFCRVIVPTQLIGIVLYWNHDSKMANHQGFERTVSRIKQRYFWPKLVSDTETYVRSCLSCQLNKEAIPYFNTKFHSMKLIPTMPGEILCMDIAHLPRSTEGYTGALIIVDLFSRLTDAQLLRNMTASEIVKAVTGYCCQQGFPSIIFTDHARAFKKALSDDCSHLLSIQHDTSIPWRHCSNISERYIRMVKDGLKMMMPSGRFGWWARYIKFVIYAINTSVCRSIGTTPFQAHYHRKTRNDPSMGDLPLNQEYVVTSEEWLKAVREEVRNVSVNMKDRYIEAKNVNNSKPEGSVAVGDLVVIKRHDFLAEIPDKLQARREGPLQVVGMQGTEVDLMFLDGGTRKRHLSEVARFYERPDRLKPEKAGLKEEGNRNLRVQPIIEYGDLKEKVNQAHLIVVGIDAVSIHPSTLTVETLMESLTFYRPYTKVYDLPPAEEQGVNIMLRPLGDVFMMAGKTRATRNQATVATVVTQMDSRVIGKVSDIDYGSETKEDISDNGFRDSSGYLAAGLDNLYGKLEGNESGRPRTGKIFIDAESILGKQDQYKSNDTRLQLIERFVWRCRTLGLSTTLLYDRK